jgi:hypothetical protein
MVIRAEGDVLLRRIVAMSFRSVFLCGLNVCRLNACVAAQEVAPESKVAGHAIISERDLRARIDLPQSVEYAGADRFVLYGIADCELHAFVESDAQKNVQRLYWVQFEGYLPSKPDLHHKYDSPRHTTIGGLDFYVECSRYCGGNRYFLEQQQILAKKRYAWTGSNCTCTHVDADLLCSPE